MKRFVLLAILVFVGVMAWRIGGRMSADAVGVAVGLVFGILASVPAALLVIAAGRRSEQRDRWAEGDSRNRRGSSYPHAQPAGGYPPVVVVAPPGYPGQAGGGYPGQTGAGWPGQHPALPGPGLPIEPSPQRQFHMVGEEDEWIDDWNGG